MQNTIFAALLGALVILSAFSSKAAFSSPALPDDDTVCIAQYAPAACRGQYGGELYIATGGNICLTIKSMVENINNAYFWFLPVRAQDIEDLICIDLDTQIQDSNTPQTAPR
jgi:hypothetical protein